MISQHLRSPTFSNMNGNKIPLPSSLVRQKIKNKNVDNLSRMIPASSIQKQNHHNPSQIKIPYPLLKHAPHKQENSKCSGCHCPQIQKIRNNRSLANITNNNHYEGNLMVDTPRNWNISNRSSFKKNEQRKYEYLITESDQTQSAKQLRQLFGLPSERKKIPSNQKKHEFLMKDDKNQQNEAQKQYKILLQENKKLQQQLSQKQQHLEQRYCQLQKIQKKYIRMLEVTNQKSQVQISMLMRDRSRSSSKMLSVNFNTSLSRLNNLSLSKQKSRKCKNESILNEKVMSLKQKLDSLDISCINTRTVNQNEKNNSVIFEEDLNL